MMCTTRILLNAADSLEIKTSAPDQPPAHHVSRRRPADGVEVRIATEDPYLRVSHKDGDSIAV